MTTNAQHPDHRQLGDVGHGVNFGADLFYLFRAGTTNIPETALRFAEATEDVHSTSAVLDGLATNSGERAMRQLAGIRQDLHFALRRTAVNMNETGDALVDTAKEYLRTDEAAQARFQELRNSRHHEGEIRQVPDFVPPTRPGESPVSEDPHRYGLPGRA